MMEKWEQERAGNREKRVAVVLRKKCIRFMVYIYVFFVVLHRKISIRAKKRLAEGLCAGVMVLVITFSLFGHSGWRTIDSKTAVDSAFFGNHNRITSGQTTASIEMNQSRVSEGGSAADGMDADSGQVSMDGNSGQVSTDDGSDREINVVETNPSDNLNVLANKVEKNARVLSEVQTLIENNGEKRQSTETAMCYQYPVEIGYDKEKNYDGVQTAGDYIMQEMFETDEQEDKKEFGQESEEIKGDEDGNGEESLEQKPLESEKSNGEKHVSTIEKFQERVWSAILPTAAVVMDQRDEEKEKHTKVRGSSKKSEDRKEKKSNQTDDAEQSTESDAKQQTLQTDGDSTGQDSSVEGNFLKEEDEAEESSSDKVEEDVKEDSGKKAEEKVIADAGYFTVRGAMRSGADAFVGDVTITPTGVDGFTKVRIGEKGDFSSTVVLTEEAADECITLYFSDGTRITSGVDYTYSKDTVAPVLVFDEEKFNKLQSEDKIINCTSDNRIPVEPADNVSGVDGTGVDKVCYVYSDRLKYTVDSFEDTRIEVPENFYGHVLMNCSDVAGNTSDILSKYFLVENQAPEIRFAEDSFCTIPYTFWVDIADNGHIVSGIRDIKCTVNGDVYDIANLRIIENTTLDKGLDVPSQCEFSIPFSEEGNYTVSVTVTDNAGNTTTREREIVVAKPDLVSVFMPEEFTIHIDPQQLAGKEQIYSDDITLINNSDFDVQVRLENVKVYVNDGMSDTGIKKDCNIYLIAPDTGEKIALKKGNNKNTYSYCLPKGAQGDIEKLQFVGEISEGSDMMWRDSDIAICVNLSFVKNGK